MYDFVLVIITLFLVWIFIKLKTERGVFVPLPMRTVRQMLEVAKIKKDDVLYDLGSGDGRVIVEAAKKYGINAVGIEKDLILYFVSRLNLKVRKLENRVKVLNKDFFNENLKAASIVTIYLTPKLNEMLKPKFKKELRKGARIVSAAHEIKGWKPVKKIKTGHFWTYLYKFESF